MKNDKNDKMEFFKHLWGPSMTPEGKRAYTVLFALYALPGLFIPETILTDHAWAREFTDFMARIVPQIDRITALNIAPEFNRFYYSLLWILSLPVPFLLYHSMRQDIELGLHPPKRKIAIESLVGIYILFTFFIIFTMYLWIGIGFLSSQERIVQKFFGNFIMRALWGSMMVLVFWGSIIYLLVMTQGLMRGQIKINWWSKISW